MKPHKHKFQFKCPTPICKAAFCGCGDMFSRRRCIKRGPKWYEFDHYNQNFKDILLEALGVELKVFGA